MQNFVSLWESMFSIVSDFLLSPPVIWFVGCMILILIGAFIRKLIR